jgi:hypothetical protein
MQRSVQFLAMCHFRDNSRQIRERTYEKARVRCESHVIPARIVDAQIAGDSEELAADWSKLFDLCDMYILHCECNSSFWVEVTCIFVTVAYMNSFLLNTCNRMAAKCTGCQEYQPASSEAQHMFA